MVRLRVRGPTALGYEVFLDEHLVATSLSARQAAVYVRDAALIGGTIVPEHVDPSGGFECAMPPEIARALAASGDSA